MKKTQEQLDIIEAAKTLDKMKINAYAGAAKTSTLAMVAEEIQERSLLLVFNKSAQIDAMSRFPDHVEVRTTHSIAYQAIGRSYQAKLTRPKGGYVNVAGTGSEIAKFFGVKPLKGKTKTITAPYIGLLAKDCVGCFESSSSEKIGTEHLKGMAEAVRRYEVKLKDLQKKVLDLARRLWQERIDVCSDVLCTHDTYMKLYRLSKPKLDYRVIYLDEAQDTSDCVLDIFKNQEGNAKLIMVGDSRQQIYGWRGAVNAMKKLHWPVKNLTTTFRFGQDISDLAGKILGGDTRIKSMDGLSSNIGDNVVDTSKPYTVLYRTNACLVMDAVRLLSNGGSVNLEVDVADFLRKLESSLALYEGNLNKVKHEELLSFDDWKDFTDEAEFNGELKRIQSIVEDGKVQWVISSLNKQSNVINPSVVYTTAHKSKGREWDQIILGDDYPSCFLKGEWVGLEETEQNLLYVACTRAKKALNTNKTVDEIVYYGEAKKACTVNPMVEAVELGHFGGLSDERGIIEFIDNNVNQEYRLQAYESFLDDEQNCGEYGAETFEEQRLFMPMIGGGLE